MITITNNMAQSIHYNPAFSLKNMLSFLLLFMGVSILLFWIFEISKNYKKLIHSNFTWKNESGEIMWFHISAEIITAFFLLAAGFTTLLKLSTASIFVAFSAGLLFYTSLNSLSWVFAEKSRYVFFIPMSAGLATSLFALYLIVI